MSLLVFDEPRAPSGRSWESGGCEWILAADGAPEDGLRVVGLIRDDDADYSFDDWVLAKDERGWWLFAAAGCSCPSNEEMARVEKGPAPLADLKAHIESGDYQGYTLPKKQAEQFAELFAHAEKFQ